MATPSVLTIKVMLDGSQAVSGLSTVTGSTSKLGGELSKTAGQAKPLASVSAAMHALNDATGGALTPLVAVTDNLQQVGAVGEAGGDKVLKYSRGLGVVGGAATAAGVALQAMASKDEAAHGQLQASIATTGKSYATYSGQIEDTIKTGEHYGQTADQTMSTLSALTLATKDPAKAMKDYQVVLDLAAAKHISLAAATNIVAKATEGNTRSLKVYGITTKDGALAVSQLADKLRGQADPAASTFSGHIASLRAHLEDMGASLGQKIGPALTVIGPAMMGLSAGVEVFKALGAATRIAAAAQWLLNAAEDASPIGIAVIAIAALVAVIILAYKHFDTFRGIVNDVWGAIKDGAKGAISGAEKLLNGLLTFLKGWGGLALFALGPFIAIPALIILHWNTVTAWFKKLPGDIGKALSGLLQAVSSPFTNALSAVVRFFSRLPGQITGALSGLASAITSPFTSAFATVKTLFDNAVAGWKSIVSGALTVIKGVWNTFAGVWNAIPGVHLGGQKVLGHKLPSVDMSLPQLPKFARGGYVSGPTLALLGEAGPEYVVPAGKMGAGSSYVINVQVAPLTNPAEVGRAVVEAVRAFQRASGVRVLATP